VSLQGHSFVRGDPSGSLRSSSGRRVEIEVFETAGDSIHGAENVANLP
jgi:hypothetical protein